MSPRSGVAPVPGGAVWYRVAGDGPGVPLLVLHGGPGSGSDYLGTLDGLGGRPVVYYDQLGAGRSSTTVATRPGSRTHPWTLTRFVTEVGAVRRTLGLDEVVLLGHSWGGWLAIEHVLRGASGVRGLCLASTSASLPQQYAELCTLRADLPADVVAVLDEHELVGDHDTTAYRLALMEFYRRHLYRGADWPPELRRAVTGSGAGSAAYTTLLGPNEMVVDGSMRDWERVEDLAAITAPTLVTVGRHDEITPACARTLHEHIPGSQLEVFEDSAHMPHLEETARYLTALESFLAHCDTRPTEEDR